MIHSYSNASFSKLAQDLKKLLFLSCITVLISCSSSNSSTDTVVAKSSIDLVNAPITNLASVKTEQVDLMSSLAELYPNGQISPEHAALANKALAQNPAALSYIVESTSSVRSQSTFTTIQPQATAADYLPVTRVQNTTLYGAYFFSIYPSEVTTALATNRNWRLEGPAFWASLATGTDLFPVHRFQNKLNGSYLYTIYDAERANIAATLSATFAYEGVAWYARQTPGTGWSPLYRFRNKTNGTYLFSAYESEKDAIVANYPAIFELEGIAYYVRQDAPPLTVLSLSLTPTVAGTVPAGVSSKLNATALMSNGNNQDVSINATWTSSNSSVATPLLFGNFSTIAPGTSTITATYGGQNSTYNLTVVNAVLKSVSIWVPNMGFAAQPSIFAQGDVRPLQLDANYTNSTSAVVAGTWSSSVPSVATVSASGVLTTLSPGSTVLTATYGGFTATKSITVATPLTIPLITVTCNAAAPMAISAVTWNSKYATDPTNTTKWIVTDWATCGTRAVVKLIYKTTANASSGYKIFEAVASPNSSFYLGLVSNSGSNPQLTSGQFVDVSYSATAGDIFYSSLYTITIQ
jgi:Bacterial Ig-like domain (group 2)/Repeat of unknown function (DUF5648)